MRRFFTRLTFSTLKVVGRAGLIRSSTLPYGQRVRVVVSLRSARTCGSHPALLYYQFHLESGGPCWIDSLCELTLRATRSRCRLASLGSNLWFSSCTALLPVPLRKWWAVLDSNQRPID